MSAAGDIELKALADFTGSSLYYTLAFLVFAWGFKKALLDQDKSGWMLILISMFMAAFVGIFNTTRTFSYDVLSPLSPSGQSTDLVPK